MEGIVIKAVLLTAIGVAVVCWLYRFFVPDIRRNGVFWKALLANNLAYKVGPDGEVEIQIIGSGIVASRTPMLSSECSGGEMHYRIVGLDVPLECFFHGETYLSGNSLAKRFFDGAQEQWSMSQSI